MPKGKRFEVWVRLNDGEVVKGEDFSTLAEADSYCRGLRGHEEASTARIVDTKGELTDREFNLVVPKAA